MSFTIDQGHEQSVFAELLNVEELEEVETEKDKTESLSVLQDK